MSELHSYGPAYRIVTPRLVVRCLAPTDATMMHDAINASIPALRPWMPWAANEPQPIEARRERLRMVRGQFDLGHDFSYGVFDPSERELVGGAGLHTRQGPFIREIGYWIATAHTKKGYATEVSNALMQVAFRIDGVPRVEIRCDPSNLASVAVARKLGMKHEGVLRANTVSPDGSVRDTALFSALKAELDELPASKIIVQAFDAVGERLL